MLRRPTDWASTYGAQTPANTQASSTYSASYTTSRYTGVTHFVHNIACLHPSIPPCPTLELGSFTQRLAPPNTISTSTRRKQAKSDLCADLWASSTPVAKPKPMGVFKSNPSNTGRNGGRGGYCACAMLAGGAGSSCVGSARILLQQTLVSVETVTGSGRRRAAVARADAVHGYVGVARAFEFKHARGSLAAILVAGHSFTTKHHHLLRPLPLLHRHNPHGRSGSLRLSRRASGRRISCWKTWRKRAIPWAEPSRRSILSIDSRAEPTSTVAPFKIWSQVVSSKIRRRGARLSSFVFLISVIWLASYSDW